MPTTNKAVIKAKSKKYYEKNKAKIKKKRKAHFEANKERILARNRELYRINDKCRETARRKRNNKTKAIKHLGGMCKDCNTVYPNECFDFHHENPNNKEYEVSKILCNSWESVMLEVDKCVLLCANCHRIRHANEDF